MSNALPKPQPPPTPHLPAKAMYIRSGAINKPKYFQYELSQPNQEIQKEKLRTTK